MAPSHPKIVLDMNIRNALLGLLMCLMAPLSAQQSEVDVTKLVADTKTLIFSNNKNTVKGYIYSELEARTSCCGSDRIYFEVRIDPSGHVLQVKLLSGNNECFKNAAADILKNIKWDTRDFRGPKSIYFEIRPEVDCEAGRNNQYKPLPVFNNPILQGQAEPTGLASGSQPQTQPASPEPQPSRSNEPAAQPAPAQPASEPVAQPAVAQPAAPQPAASQPAASAQPQPSATQDPALVAAQTPMTTTAPSNLAAENAEAERLAREKAEAERIAMEKELEQLKRQMDKLRADEEKRRQQALAQEQARKEKEARTAQAQGGSGGLFLDDQDPKAKPAEQNPQAVAANDDERFRQELRDLEARKAEIEKLKREREEEARRRLEENQRANDDLLRIEEQIADKQEEAERRREQQELDRLEQDRRTAEETRRREEEEYQRTMAEIKRLQDEANLKIAQLEDKKRDMDRMTELKRAREQEIALERALREQERQRKLEEVRISLYQSGQPLALISDNPQAGLSALPDFSAQPDSEKLLVMIQTINQLQREMAILQEQIRMLGGTPATPSVSGRGTAAPAAAPARGGGVSAAQNQSWRSVDYYAPNTQPSDYVVAGAGKAQQAGTSPSPQSPAGAAPGFRPGAGYSPDPSHSGTHANAAGPQFGARSYVEGNDKMKELIKTRLKENNVCGLAQAVFSVTLNPAGNVVRHSVLAASSPAVELQLNGILPTLRFSSIESGYNQTVYLEFKAEILCGGATKVNLGEVPAIIKE
jgi:hypothetical protein